MTSIDLLPDADEESLRTAVRELLTESADPTTVLGAFEAPGADFTALRSALLADMGLGELLISEEAGGAGASFSTAGVAADEIGRATAPVPFLTSAAMGAEIATAAAAASGESASAAGTSAARDVCERIVSGDIVIPAVPADSADFADTDVTAQGDEAQVSLSGEVSAVAEADVADLLLVPARRGEELLIVAVHAADTSISRFRSLDETRPLADVRLNVAPGQVIASGRTARTALQRARLVGLAMLACEDAGVAARVFEIGLDYIKGRRQFARTIGSFQAIKHRMADAWIAVMQLGAAAQTATRTLDAQEAAAGSDAGLDGEEAAVAVLTAASYAKKVATHIAEEVLQFHGGAGMTWEYPVHLYLKRAKANEVLLGTREQINDQLSHIIEIEE